MKIPAALCFGLLALLSFLELRPANIAFSNDAGVSFAVAESMLRGEIPLLGPPSHLGGRHFGPVYYWGLALELWLAGGDTYRAILLDSGIKLLTIFCYLGFLLRLIPGRTGWIATSIFLLLLSSGQFVSIIRFPWHSSFLLLPASLLFWSVARAINQPPVSGALPFALACLTFQTHFASFPFILALGLVFYLHTSAAQKFKNWKRLGFYFACGAALFLPALIYELRFDSNFGALLKAHSAGTSSPAGFTNALFLYSEFFRLSLSGYNIFESIFGNFAFAGKILLAASGLSLALRVYIYADRKKRLRLLLVILPLIIYLPFLPWLAKPLFHFYLNSIAVFPALLIVVLAVHALSLVANASRQELAGIKRIDLAGAKLSALIFLSLISYVLLCSIALNAKHIKSYSIPITGSLAHAQEMARIIQADSRSEAEPVKILIRSSARFRESAIYYFLGATHYPLMQFASSLKELSSFSKKGLAAPNTAYFISCPDSDGVQGVRMGQEVARKWDKNQEISLAHCQSCADCRMLRMQRKKG